jgi:hypothetical protein
MCAGKAAERGLLLCTSGHRAGMSEGSQKKPDPARPARRRCFINTVSTMCLATYGRFQRGVATVGFGGFKSSYSSAAAGVMPPRVFRGRWLSSVATSRRRSGPWALRFVPFGKYWRNSPVRVLVRPALPGRVGVAEGWPCRSRRRPHGGGPSRCPGPRSASGAGAPTVPHDGHDSSSDVSEDGKPESGQDQYRGEHERLPAGQSTYKCFHRAVAMPRWVPAVYPAAMDAIALERPLLLQPRMDLQRCRDGPRRPRIRGRLVVYGPLP